MPARSDNAAMIDLRYEEELLFNEISNLLLEKQKITAALHELLNKQATIESLLDEKFKKTREIRAKLNAVEEANSRALSKEVNESSPQNLKQRQETTDSLLAKIMNKTNETQTNFNPIEEANDLAFEAANKQLKIASPQNRLQQRRDTTESLTEKMKNLNQMRLKSNGAEEANNRDFHSRKHVKIAAPERQVQQRQLTFRNMRKPKPNIQMKSNGWSTTAPILKKTTMAPSILDLMKTSGPNNWGSPVTPKSNSSLAISDTPPEPTLYDIILQDKQKEAEASIDFSSPPKQSEPAMRFEYSSLKFKVLSVLFTAQLYELRPVDQSSISFMIDEKLFEILSDYKNNKYQFKYRVFLRMSRFNDEQRVYFDSIPTKVRITINGKTPFLRGENDENSDFVRMPVDITKQCWDKPNNVVKLEVDEGDEMEVVVGVYFVRALSVEESMNLFHQVSTPRKHELGLKAVQMMLDDASDTPMKACSVPLVCPSSKKRIQIPCLGLECTHVACFDLRSFLESHRKTLLWNCPICGKLIESSSLVADGLMTHILNTISPQCNAIRFNENGSWTEVQEVAVDTDDQASSSDTCESLSHLAFDQLSIKNEI